MSFQRLLKAAENSQTDDEFIHIVQKSAMSEISTNLLKDLYDWEFSTRENRKRFANTGWFGMASIFWSEHA